MLNHSKTPEWKTSKDAFVLDGGCVEQLKRIMMFTNAGIVLSSTWRLSDKGCKVVADAVELFDDITVIGKTPILGWGDKYTRKDEILKWLEAIWPLSFGWNGEVITHMAVLDDDTDADLGDGSFFKTDFEGGGLTKEIADKIIIHFGGDL